MAVGDVYRVQVFYNIGSELTMNVIHLQEKTANTEPIPAQQVVSAVIAKWIAIFETDLFSDEVYIPLVKAIRISPNASVPGLSILGATTVNGTNVVPPVPSTSALLISLYTNTFTANARGRIYIPGVGRDQQNDGQLVDAALTLANQAANDLEADWTPTGGTGTYDLVVWSRELVTSQVVTQCIAHSNLATQRSRRAHPGIGT